MSGPIERWVYHTSDVDEGAETIRAQYADHSPRFSGSPDGFVMHLEREATVSRAGRFNIDEIRHTMRTTTVAEPPDQLMAVMEEGGWTRVTCGRAEATATMLLPMWSRYTVNWDNLRTTTVQLDVAGVQRVGAEMAGIDPDGVRFTAMNPISANRSRYLRSVIHHIRSAWLHDDVMASPILRSEAFRELARAFLITFPNTTIAADVPDDGSRSGLSAVGRAQAFVDEYAHEDIDPTAIAEAARLSPRGLRHAFLRHVGCTTWQYVDRVRMERAHRDLTAGDPAYGDTVGAIAARWGFAHPGGFSVTYRRLYGWSPDDTLNG